MDVGGERRLRCHGVDPSGDDLDVARNSGQLAGGRESLRLVADSDAAALGDPSVLIAA